MTDLAWICCGCDSTNTTQNLLCEKCAKRRWSQLGIPVGAALGLWSRIKKIILGGDDA